MKNNKVYKEQKINNINMLPGDLKGSPDESFSEKNNFNKTVVFIDEAFLSRLSKYFGYGEYIKFDRYLFSKKIAQKERLILYEIFLYIAPPFQSEPPTKEEERKKVGYDKLVNKLKEKGIVVKEGRCQRLKIGGKYNYKQKGVDVLLGVDLALTPVKYPEIKKIILIACDSDFVPVIKSLREFGIKTILYTYYQKKRDTNFSRSNDLIKSVYKYVLLSKQDFLDASLNKSEDKKN